MIEIESYIEIYIFLKLFRTISLLRDLGLYPLLHISHYSVHMTKISILKYEGTIKKISYERRVYESVDGSSLS